MGGGGCIDRSWNEVVGCGWGWDEGVLLWRWGFVGEGRRRREEEGEGELDGYILVVSLFMVWE